MLSVHKKEMSVKQPTAKKSTKKTSPSSVVAGRKTATKKPAKKTTITTQNKVEETNTKKKNKARTIYDSSTSLKKSESQKKSSTKTSKELSKDKIEDAAIDLNKIHNNDIETAVFKEKLTMKPPKPTEPKTTESKEIPKAGLRHQDSVGLYGDGWKPGQHLVVTKSSSEVTFAEPRKNPNRPIFHLPLNLNDSTASFQGTSQGYLEMSSGLVPHQPHNKYNFRISLDETNDMSQTANMLRNCIFDENNQWNSSRTESSHIQKNQQQQQQQQHQQQQHQQQKQLSLPEGFDEKDNSFIIPSTETTNRSFNNPGRTSTRLSFLYNKSTGLLCKNCFSSSCDHMDKFNTLATPKLRKVFQNNSVDRLEANSSDVSQKSFSFDNVLHDDAENMRLVEINDFYHHDVSSGEKVPFREISMEYEETEIMKFETSTPNGVEEDNIAEKSSTNQNNLNMSGSMLRYTPGIMGDNTGYQQQPQQQQFSEQQRPRTNDSLKYDSDYDDDNYLQAACQTSSANSTFETLDINSGVLFSNIEQQERDPPVQSSTPIQSINQQQQQRQQNTSSDNRKIKGRRKSLITLPDLPTVFEEKSAPNSAIPDSKNRVETHEAETNREGLGIQEILETVTGSLANMFDDISNESNDMNDDTPKSEKKEKAKQDDEMESNLNLKDSLEEDEDEEDGEKDGVESSPEDSPPQKKDGDGVGERMTPLESQGIFRRIQNEEDEVQPIEDEDLQEVLQENRKHTFERHYFYGKHEDAGQLDESDREVLQINTPQWADKQPQESKESVDASTNPEKETKRERKKSSNKQSKQPAQVDASTQADDLPFSPPKISPVNIRTPQTGDSSDTLETQGSYRKIDLLVLDHGRRQNHRLNNIPVLIPDNLETRDADSGVHSDHTAQSSTQSEAANLNSEQLQNNFREIADEDNLPEFDRDSSSNISQNNRDEYDARYSPRGSFYEGRSARRNTYMVNNHVNKHVNNHVQATSQHGVYADERVFLPAIDTRYFPPLSNENDLYFSEAYNNRLVYNRRLASPYYSSDFGDRDVYEPRHRDTVSPMLEHHLRMAHYHRERVALLTPLYSTSASIYSRRHIPEPHPPLVESQHNISRTYKRRYSSTRNMFYESQKSDYLETLSDISPLSFPFAPHPPSCHSDQMKSRRIIPDEHRIEADSNWQRKNKIGAISRNCRIDNEHELYLTTPYRSIFRK